MLAAFIACDAVYDDEELMSQFNELEVQRLLSCAAFVYYGGCVYCPHEKILYCHVFQKSEFETTSYFLLRTLSRRFTTIFIVQEANVTDFQRLYCAVFEWMVAQIQNSMLKEKKDKWDLLVGCHTIPVDDPATKEIDNIVTTHSGRRAVIPFWMFTHEIPTRCLFLDCCCGNQITLEDIVCDYIVCARASVDYVGLVTENFVDAYPDIRKVIKQAQEGAQWCTIVL